MNARAYFSFAICLLGPLVLAVASAQAQATKIFVASFGNDSNDGSRGAPKRNFQAAHDAVAAGGEVVALDTAGYGVLAINKSIGITAPAGITGFITATASSNVAITVNTATTDTVTLRGLTLNTVSGGIDGVRVNGVGTLEVDSCVISGFGGPGVNFSPSSAATLLVKNSTLRDNDEGILVQPSAAAVKWVIDGCRLESNIVGLAVQGSVAAHRVELRDTLFSGNGSVAVSVNSTNSRVALQNCTLSANGFGLSVPTSGATAKVDNCVITNNVTGLSRAAGAVLLSRGNNTVENNGTDGTFSGSYNAK